MVADEYEAIRLKDYHNFNQKESAELMNISQSTFHRILNSARKKLQNFNRREKINIIELILTKKYLSLQNCGLMEQ